MAPPVDAAAAAPPAPGSVTSEPVDVPVPDPMPHSLHSAVYARRAEYVRPHRVRVKVGTWNVAACPGTDHDLAAWFVDGKGVDRRLSNIVAASSNGALEREPSTASAATERDELEAGGDDPAAVRVIGNDKIGLYVLGLQEVVDLNMASQYMSRVYAADAGTPAMERWKTALELALPAGYERVASEQMSGLLLLVYASPEIASMVSHVSTSAVGTGLLGLLGNKGSVSANVVLGESTRMVFVNSHLASGTEASNVDRRCWDVSHIESRTQFEPYNHPGLPETKEPEKISDADFAFWFGDLNFRLDLPGDDIRRILTLHAKGEYDLSKAHHPAGDSSDGAGGASSLAGEEAVVLKKPGAVDSRNSWASAASAVSGIFTESTASTAPTDDDDEDAADNMKTLPPIHDDNEDFVPDPSEDPASLQATLDSLLPHDQLSCVIKDRKAFYNGWREGRITFLPSYKYDVGTVGLFDSSEKRRAPSWCDRILYRTRKDKDDHEQMVKDKEEAKKRDEEMTRRGLDHAGDDDEVLFEYQPDTDGDRRPSAASSLDYDEYDDGEYNPDEDNEDAPHENGTGDRIHLDIYTSHQRIQSSDHKPVVSLFTVDFDAVVPELKAIVHAEVAKELDRTENESRPAVTIVVDSRVALHPATKSPSAPPDTDEAVGFGQITFLQKSAATLTLANTGRVPAVFSFVEKPTTEDLAASGPVAHPYQWLTTTFVRQDKEEEEEEGPLDVSQKVTLEPGETVNALLEVFVGDLVFARMLNDGVSQLEDVLVLRVEDGRDHFIPVRGVWAPTCIGRSIEELVRVPDGGIRAFVAALVDEAAKKSGKRALGSELGSISYDLDVRCSAPKELFKLTETIENLVDRALADEQMLEEYKIPSDRPGWPFENPTQAPENRHVVAAINALDNDRPILDAFEPEVPSLLRLEVVSHILLLFLRGLTDGVVTIPLWARIDQATLLSLSTNGSSKNASNPIARDPNAEADKNTILDILSSTPHHNISFVFLTATLSRIIAELSPLSLGDLDALRSISRNNNNNNNNSGSSSASGGGFSAAIGGIGSIGRRSLSTFRKAGASPASAALEALDRRMARERRYAEIFGTVMCRAPLLAKERERKAQDDKQRAVVELFLRRSREELGG
ncbi:hypothetical protein SCUCBS95973_007169 [Sporothrix curviconia]|uniref:Inositol polyphosphate-related phosphatase domain-containing protein n=1 Tax=Sporothrix curviconia TaxID=1260050 RepID=A0ABP0CB72_9PEZI